MASLRKRKGVTLNTDVEWTFIRVGWRYRQEIYLGLGTENVVCGRL